MKVYKLILGMVVMLLGFASCHNNDVTFPDFDYQTVYFASQYPVRTVELGKDLFVDNSLDNQHKIEIKATTGGAYSNKNDIYIDYVVDESLCDDLYFKDSDVRVVAMPTNYYNLASNQIEISSGEILGGVEVQLTDAFFADPKAISTNYVIPLVMKEVSGVDSILSGNPVVDDPDRVNAADWSIKPKDFVLYAVKYVNPWHGNYLRRGVDAITNGSNSSTVVRHKKYVENDEVTELTTLSFSEVKFMPDGYTNHQGVHLPLPVKFTFNENQECNVTPERQSIQVNDSVRVYNIVAQGNGVFVPDGEKNSISGFDRDAIYLDYDVEFEVETTFPKLGNAPVYEVQHYVTKDTLVCRDRGVIPDYFDVTKQ